MFDLGNFISPKQLQAMKKDVVEETLALAYPIVAMEFKNGVLIFAENPSISLQKTSELYDRIAFAGTGVFNDYERLRKAGVQLADVRGFQYSRPDVKARSIASEFSTVLGDIFVQQHVPMEVEILLAEIGETPTDNRLYVILFSGGLIEKRSFAVIGDYVKEDGEIKKDLIDRHIREQKPTFDMPIKETAALCRRAIGEVRDRGGLPIDNVELVVLDRTIKAERKFRRFGKKEIAAMLG
jgi:proteasome alpha subunit